MYIFIPMYVCTYVHIRITFCDHIYVGDVKRVNLHREGNITFNNGSTNATLNISILDTTNCTNADEFQLCIDPETLNNYSKILNSAIDIAKHSASVIIIDDDCRGKYCKVCVVCMLGNF